MNIYSKTLKKEVSLNTYEREGKVIIPSNQLFKLFQELKGKRKFSDLIMGKDYSYARCEVYIAGILSDADGDCNAAYEESEINKNHVGMAATRRAFDRAFLQALQLDMPVRIYSSSEGICDDSGINITEDILTPTDTIIEDEAGSDPDFEIGDSSDITDEIPEEIELSGNVSDNSSDLAETPDEVPAEEAEDLPEELAPEGPTKEENISFAAAKAHKLTFKCAQQGKTLQQIYEEKKVTFLKQILRYAVQPGNEDMLADSKYVKVFLDNVA